MSSLIDSSILNEIQDPNKYKGCVPMNTSLPMFIKNVSGHTLLKVTPGVGSMDVYQTGVVVANFRDGYNSLFLYAPTPSTTPAAVITLVAGTASITPRYPFTMHRLIPVSPNLDATVSIGHLAAACLTVQANTQSTTAAALSGEVAAAAIVDYRDVTLWSQAELTQLAMTATSGFLGARLSELTSVWLGPDAVDSAQCIDPSRVAYTGSNVIDTFDIPPASYQTVTLNVNGTVAGAPTLYTIDAPRLPPRTGINVSVGWGNSAPGPFVFTVSEVYIRANADPGLAVDHVIVKHQMSHNGTSTADNWQVSFPNLGLDKTLLDQGYTLGAITAQTMSGQIFKFIAEYRDVYSPRNFGGWRFVRWSDAGVGQNLSVGYTGAVTGVATGTIASYIRSQDLPEVTPAQWDSFRRLYARNILSRVDNGPTPTMLRGGEVSTINPQRESTQVRMGLLGDIGNTIDHVVGLSGGRTGPVYAAGMYK